MKLFFGIRSLLVQMIIAFITIVILASATVGLPAIWLLQNQLDSQAWSQVEQGQRVTGALYNAHYNEILNLATLIAQRPTLHELLAQNDVATLTSYLITLQESAELDKIAICNSEDQLIATTDPKIPEAACRTWKNGIYQHDQNIPLVCLIAHQSIESATGYLGEAFVCSSLDDNFEMQLRDQTGLEHILWIEETPVSTSLKGGVIGLESNPPRKVAKNENASAFL